MSKIITHLYDSYPQAEQAVNALKNAGFPENDISIVAHETDVKHAPADVREPRDETQGEAAASDAAAGAGVGGLLGGGAGALAGLGMLAVPGLGPVVAAGWLATTALGAVVGGVVGAGAGGIVGTLTHAGVSQEEAEFYAEAVRRGGTLVSVQVSDSDPARAALADDILERSGYVNLNERRAAYRASGWEGYRDDAPPYTQEQIDAERRRWMEFN